MYNQTTSISSSYFPNTGLPQALSERSESAGAPISVHYNWPELESISINSVLLRTDSIGDFARNWYKSACAIVFQPYDSAERIIVGTGSLIADNTVRTARHVFENGDGYYYCRFFDFNNNQTSFLDRSIFGNIKQAEAGVDLADIPLKSLNKNDFQKYCKVIYAVNDDQHPEGHVVMFHFANGEFKLSVAYVDADDYFTFQQRIFAAAGDGASGAALIWQQLDGTVSIGAHSVYNHGDNQRAIIQAAQFNTCFHLPTPESAPYHPKYDQSQTLAKGPNGEGPEFVRYYVPDNVDLVFEKEYLTDFFAILRDYVFNITHTSLGIRDELFEEIKETENLVLSKKESKKQTLLHSLCTKINTYFGVESSEEDYIKNNSQYIHYRFFSKLFDSFQTLHKDLIKASPQNGLELSCFELPKSSKKKSRKIHFNEDVLSLNKEILPDSFQYLVNTISKYWKKGIVFDFRLTKQLKDDLSEATKNSSVPGSMRSSHQNINGVLPHLNLNSLSQISEIYRQYCDTQLNSGSSDLSSTANGYVEYTINLSPDHRLVFDYVTGIFYISFTHYNFWEFDGEKISKKGDCIPQTNSTYSPFFKLI